MQLFNKWIQTKSRNQKKESIEKTNFSDLSTVSTYSGFWNHVFSKSILIEQIWTNERVCSFALETEKSHYVKWTEQFDK